MKAKDVMTTTVVSVGPDTGVPEIARLLLERHISAVPVVDDAGRVIGMVSEGDLMRRPESETEGVASWWLALLAAESATRYLKTHGLRAREVMTREVVSVTEDAPLEEIATLLERKHIKRVPVLRDGKLVGIVSRANLLHGLVARASRSSTPPASNPTAIREAVVAELRAAGLLTAYVNVVIADGTAQLWGGVESAVEAEAIALAAARTPGVDRVENNLFVLPARLIGSLGGE
ncbi:MAG TPA: CBS domain-containing protein [Burkholderiales bacterium]|jgi:CBS domain-containing protein|nr:CBS domain-containing protein [Burkholderiales bacterium]